MRREAYGSWGPIIGIPKTSVSWVHNVISRRVSIPSDISPLASMANSAGFPLSVWGYIARVARHAWGLKPARYGENYVTGIGHGVINGVRGKLLDHECLGLDLDHSCEIGLDNT